MPNRPSHLSRRRQHLPVWRVILADLVTAALILALYAVFKLLIPAMQRSPVVPTSTPAAAVATPAPTPAPETPAPTGAPTPEAAAALLG